MRAATLPALADRRWLRFAAFTAFYLVQGFPLGLLSVAVPAWLIANGTSGAASAGFLAVTGLPWAFKVVAGPFMDRYVYLPMGRRRPWVIAMQLGVVVAALQLVWVTDPAAQMPLLVAVGFAINAFAAAQDVAVDGMAIDVLEVGERGSANAFMAGGQVAGTSIAGSVSALLLDAGGLPLAGLGLAAMVAAVAGIAIVLRERPGERLLPWTPGQPAPRPDGVGHAPAWRTVIRDLLRVLVLPMSLLLVAVEVVYRTMGGLGEALFPVVGVQVLGYTAAEVATWGSALGAVAAVVGLGYGLLIDRYGPERTLTVALLAGAAWYAAFGLLVDAWDSGAFVAVARTGIELIRHLLFVSMIALFMSVCGVRVAATQFAVYMAIANLARSAGAGLYVRVDAWPPQHVFLLMAAGLLLAAALLARFDRAAHRARIARVEAGRP
jgi:PAT family beta-lactamase induction signal transducer AmpG